MAALPTSRAGWATLVMLGDHASSTTTRRRTDDEQSFGILIGALRLLQGAEGHQVVADEHAFGHSAREDPAMPDARSAARSRRA